MKRYELRRIVEVHLLLIVLGAVVMFVPNHRTTVRDYSAMLVAMGVIEALFLFFLWRRKKTGRSVKPAYDIITLVWLFLLIWEYLTSKSNRAHPVLVPCPENVFDTFRLHWKIMLTNAAYSMELLFIGLFIGLAAAIVLGLFAGWIPRIRDVAYPIANVMAPIPAIVISPYLVAIMPTFRAASATVIVLGVFWPTFLTTINRIGGMEREILDSARMLNPSTWTMIRKVLLPYILPGVVGGLKVSMTTSVMMLNFAELMGATHGLGYYIQNAITYANYTHAVAGILTIGIVVTILSALVTKVQKVAIRWR